MKLTIKKAAKDTIQFRLEASVEYANALRRTLIENLPTEAPHKIEITKNTSRLDNDMIRHRLGLIPTKLNQKLMFDAHIINDTQEKMDVFSHDLSHDLVEDVLLVVLRPKEELELSVETVSGIAKQNAKWSNITGIKYNQYRKLQGKLTTDEMKKVKSIIPQFKLKQVTDFIDTNQIFMINQICGREVYSYELYDIFDMAFSTLDNVLPVDKLKQALDQLIQQSLHLEIKGNKLITQDYGLANLLTLEHPDQDFSCVRKHPLDPYFVLSDPEQLQEIGDFLAKQWKKLLEAI